MKKLHFILIFVSVLFVGQRAYFFHSASARNQSETGRLAAISEGFRQTPHLLGEGEPDGSRWVGIWLVNDDEQGSSPGNVLPTQSALEKTSSAADPDASSPMGNPVFGEVSLGNGMQAMLELHECLPGADSCQSGGMIVLLNPEGEEILNGTVTVSDGSVNYDLAWTGQAGLSEDEKLDMAGKAIESSVTQGTGRLRSSLKQIYGYESAGDLTEDELRKELLQGLLHRIIKDRISKRET